MLVACGGAERSPAVEVHDPVLLRAPAPERFGRCREFDPNRRPLFGELHVHSRYSLDANLQGTRATPADIYRFARGEEIALPPLDDAGRPTRVARIDRPLDFAAVTDHAEFLGFVAACEDPGSRAYRRMGCRLYRRGGGAAFDFLNMQTAQHGLLLHRNRACGREGQHCDRGRRDLWLDTQNAAERHLDRTEACTFTTFVGYEFTLNPFSDAMGRVHNLHRNVIFRNGIVPQRPLDVFEVRHLPDLWKRLDEDCRQGASGCDALVIPHNSNLSAGMMFGDETLAPADWRRRADLERLFEIYQHKGASECLPGTPTSDELCDFEIVPYRDLEGAKRDMTEQPEAADFVRGAFGEGMRQQRTLGVNPFAYGFVGGTDNHLGLAGNVHEALFAGGGGAGEAGADQTGGPVFPDRIYFGGGGLAGVWAEENAREAIFRALRRRETFGTSGPRIAIRQFVAWSGLDADDWCRANDDERARLGYERGVSMGGELGAAPADGRALHPTVAVSATFDPGTTTHPGARLQRLQIIKGWLDEADALQVIVHLVAGRPEVGLGLDTTTCQPSNDGYRTLCAVWRDPDFDPSRPAFYYARAIEVPTCRWTTRMCVEAGYDCGGDRPIDVACCDRRLGLNEPDCRLKTCTPARQRDQDPCCALDVVDPLVQERAWSSPVWYVPLGWSASP